MGVLSVEKPVASTKYASGSRRIFEATWQALEKRHGWSIAEEEVANPETAYSRLPFAWQDYDNRRAAAFRERHRLAEVVAGTADDWEALLRLRHWVFTSIRFGDPSFVPPSTDPTVCVEASLAGGSFWCTYYAFTFVAAAASMGFAARKVSIDSDHTADEASTQHGVADVWVDTFRKWVAFDPMYDAHYELDGVPLNAEELGRRWETHRDAGVRNVIGPERCEVPRVRDGVDNECRGYFWHFINLTNDVFHTHGRISPVPAVFPVDEARKEKVWFTGSPPKNEKNPYYDGVFLPSERYADAYPVLNTARAAVLAPTMISYCAPVRLERSCTPNFSHFALSVDGGAAFRFDGVEYPWRVHPGRCSLEVRTVNLAGHRGSPCRIVLQIGDDAGSGNAPAR